MAKKIPGLKGNPKSRRISKTAARGKMKPENKMVQGPLDPAPRIRGNKAGKDRRYLPHGHPSRTH